MCEGENVEYHGQKDHNLSLFCRTIKTITYFRNKLPSLIAIFCDNVASF